MSTLFTFPGQGAQRAGMLHALPDCPTVHATLADAAAALNALQADVSNPASRHVQSLGSLADLDGATSLESTVATQLCLLIAGVASANAASDAGGAPDAVAGLSIGAYAAAVVAGVMDLEAAIKLVALRGGLMAEAYPQGYGMTAILGMPQSALEPLIASIHTPDTPVYLANINAPLQLVVAGEHGARHRLGALALAQGARAIREIAIAVPSHCALLDAPAETLRIAVQKTSLRPPRLRYYSASAARAVRDPAAIGLDLAHNMASLVRWHETSVLAWEVGARLFVEMSPGKVLTRLCTEALPDARTVAIDDTRLDTVAALMARERVRVD
ncbi:acyltransferase domain-containing protein [Pigmentiphaga aceris]|uniref:[acyl-carrier-protein] S-malonyltransferase n=1 Tax=Pigmentiphaga aceris TaxID=1940612 RepID=A0A5C0AZI1_9BURK|nr:acyltransferase domain-containing protein [Pigmentiphaga aceris]QEI07595.1 acyltransferase domain-containing protein [Pigmentiphaga aceris]